MKKILQKPISKILVAGVLFYVFYMVNKNKGLLSIPINEEDMKNYQFNLITIDTVFAGFSFTVLGMLISPCINGNDATIKRNTYTNESV